MYILILCSHSEGSSSVDHSRMCSHLHKPEGYILCIYLYYVHIQNGSSSVNRSRMCSHLHKPEGFPTQADGVFLMVWVP